MLKQPTSPQAPTGRPRYRAPGDWAQSSTTFSPRRRAISRIGCRSGTPPITQVGATATVRGVILASILAGSMCIERSTSQNTGTPRAATTAAAVAMKPIAGTITSVPGPTPTPTKALCNAPVPELTPMAYFTPNTSRAMRS